MIKRDIALFLIILVVFIFFVYIGYTMANPIKDASGQTKDEDKIEKFKLPEDKKQKECRPFCLPDSYYEQEEQEEDDEFIEFENLLTRNFKQTQKIEAKTDRGIEMLLLMNKDISELRADVSQRIDTIGTTDYAQTTLLAAVTGLAAYIVRERREKKS